MPADCQPTTTVATTEETTTTVPTTKDTTQLAETPETSEAALPSATPPPYSLTTSASDQHLDRLIVLSGDLKDRLALDVFQASNNF